MKDSYEETMWTIVGAHGLYTGTWLTRREAILRHVVSKYGVSMTVDRAWRHCKKKGDKAIKVHITYEV